MNETTQVTATCPLCGAQSTATHAIEKFAQDIAQLGYTYHYALVHSKEMGN